MMAVATIGILLLFHVQLASALSSPNNNHHSRATSSKSQTQSVALNRRQLFQQAIAAVGAVTTTSILQPIQPAHAGGLLQFPIPKNVPLKNKYHLMRAGWSELENDGIYSTNPLFLTNRENQMVRDLERLELL